MSFVYFLSEMTLPDPVKADSMSSGSLSLNANKLVSAAEIILVNVARRVSSSGVISNISDLDVSRAGSVSFV